MKTLFKIGSRLFILLCALCFSACNFNIEDEKGVSFMTLTIYLSSDIAVPNGSVTVEYGSDNRNGWTTAEATLSSDGMTATAQLDGYYTNTLGNFLKTKYIVKTSGGKTLSVKADKEKIEFTKNGTETVNLTAASSSDTDGTGDTDGETDTTATVTGLALNQTSVKTAKDSSVELTATISPADSTETISWTVSDASVVSLSATTGATVTATTLADGTAVVTASAGSYRATCSFVVKSTQGESEQIFWRADDYDTVTEAWQTDVTLGIMTVVAKTGSKATLEERSAVVDSYEFAKAFSSGGGGSVSSNALKFTLSNATTLTIFAAAAGPSGTRNLMIKIGDTDATSLGTTTTTATTYTYSYEGTESVDCYLWSSTSSINFYAVLLDVEGTGTSTTIVYPSGISLDKTTESLTRTDDTPSPTTTLTATLAPTDVTSGYDTITWTSSDSSVATVSDGVVTACGPRSGSESATITAQTINGYKATCVVTVTSEMSARVISLSDSPVGYASLGTNYVTDGAQTVVSTRAELLAAVEKGGIIVVDGMIDMSEGMLPTTAGGSTSALDAFVTVQTTSLHAKNASTYPQVFETYEAFKTAYAALCSAATNDKSKTSTATTLSQTLWALNAAYGNVMKLNLVSNTTLIGKDASSGITGGSIQINGLSNVQVRNLTIQDAYDPFPHHEENDGFNAEWDGIVVQGASKNIWIDHCTIEDTLYTSNVTISTGGTEKWQTYDGLCDMKNDSTNITVSNCLFKNHDKTMLIGSSDSDGDNTVRFITLYQNYFYNCGQRLPMVRNTTIHILNNYYDASNAHYSNSYAVGVRKNAIIYAENNYFGSGIKQSFANSYGELYSSGNTDNSTSGCKSTVTGATLFKDGVGAYTYTALSAEDAKTQAETYAGAEYTLR